MPLSVHYVRSLADVVDPAVEFLSRPGDLFAKPRIVVPHPGAKAWLHDQLARRLGTSRPDREDGIVANVDISFPGTITALLQPPHDAATPDPWSFDRLTFAVLHVITSGDAAGLGIPIDLDREPLLAARRIAGLLDAYHVRRPGMIREWALGNRVFAPTANDTQNDGHAMAASLRDGDLWQFKTWRAVRQHLGEDRPSPPIRQSVENQQNRERLLVAGLESLSLPQLECLEKLGEVCEVDAFLVHPSPGLQTIWTTNGQQSLPENLRDRPLEKRRDPEFPAGVDSLLPVWLSGARELQDLLAARGLPVTNVEPRHREDRPASLLTRMQHTVSSGSEPMAAAHDLAADRSVVIHRCHSLSRQAEVLHDALLQAFDELEGLEPHDVVIVSPCIQKAAPHLGAVFQRTVTGRDKDGKEQTITLPLVVADRGIRETSEAADLMTALLALPGSRASIDDVLAVAGHSLMRTRFGIDDDTVATWTDLIERTKIRWGLDADHRSRRGLTLTENPDIHTWKLGLEQMLLGAMLPDAAAQAELGGVVPLTDLDPADLVAITPLVRIMDVIRTLEAATPDRRASGDWCNVIEQALVGLCGEENPQLAEPLAHLRRLRDAAAGTAAETLPVPFEDVRRLLVTWLDETSGRQPLRTGAITATSMVPLRGVPFRVICVIGYDDGVVGTGETDGDDLVARQSLVGDVDPRADERRALLDCLLAAGERLVITCNGRNVKSNKRVPLVTPLAEFVDFAVRHGVAREKLDAASGIEIDHPRHQLSRRNFEETGILPTGSWSHDATAAEVLAAAEQERLPTDRNSQTATPEDPSPQVIQAGGDGPEPNPPTGPTVTELSLLERMVKDPLGLHLKEALGFDTWRDDEEPIPATIPLTLEKKEVRSLTRALLEELIHDRTPVDAWVAAKQRCGVLPMGPHATRQVAEITSLALGLKSGAEAEDLDLRTLVNLDLDHLPLGRHQLVGSLKGIHANPCQLVIVTPSEAGKDEYGRPLHIATLHLLAARVAGIDVSCATVISRRDDWKVGRMKKPSGRHPEPRPEDPWQVRVVKLHASLMDPASATSRLDDIAALAHEAAQFPRPAFGKMLTAAASKREEEFERAVASSFYWRTSEAAMFGVSPSFEQVFADRPERLAFLEAFKRLLDPVHQRSDGGYYELS